MAQEAAIGAPISINGLMAVEGCLHGLSQPFLQAGLSLDFAQRVDWTTADEALRAAAPYAAEAPASLSIEFLSGALQRILHWTAELQRGAGDVVLEAGRLLRVPAAQGELAVLALPTIDPDVAFLALRVVVGILNNVARGAPASGAAVQDDVQRLVERRNRMSLSAGTARFLKAAHARGIPWLRLGASNVFRIGHGAQSRWIEYSLTDASSTLAYQISSDKFVAASVLRRAGVPAPAHRVVRNEVEAVTAAEALGYPVVVKPADQALGIGVRVRLRDADSVRSAFTEARKYSERALVEKFIEGRDYRMLVFRGQLVAAVERVPGGVTGDGVSSARSLVERLNRDPRRGRHPMADLNPLVFDAEALEILAEQGLDGDSVPGAGEWVRLRGRANVSGGGVPVDVLRRVHPDNRAVAERAAQAIRLDLAGVDLIVPDISRSWRETGGGVCEINARPGFTTDAYGDAYGIIVERMVRGDGRIPIAVICGAPPGSRAAALLARLLTAAEFRVGVATPIGVWVGDEPVVGPVDAFTGAGILIGDQGVDAAVVAVNEARVARTGVPFDRCKVLALAGAHLTDTTEVATHFHDLARSLIRSSSGPLVLNAEDPGCRAIAPYAVSEVILYGARPELPHIREHRARGGASAWVEEGAHGPRLMIAAGTDAPRVIEIGDAGSGPPAFSPGEIALVGAVTLGLGLDCDLLRRCFL